ncbi:MAG TPA: hypothetical protein VLI71_02870 [Gammaproteobacteria bacterium]|nr:hypothetical protein [Gammaproteobacteria bacterium]
MTSYCRRAQRPQPHQGYESLIAVDEAKGELRSVSISAFASGGLHYTRAGGIIWFSELNQALVGQEQHFIEAFSLEPQSVSERSLGRIELPFVAGAAIVTQGGECHVLTIQNRNDSSLHARLFVLFDDGDPIGLMRFLTGIEHVLFWEPLSQVFVVDRAVARSATTADRAALDCSAEIKPLDQALARRVAHTERRGAWYLAATTGDLLVNDSGDYGLRALLVRGMDVTAFPPDVMCRDPNACETYSVWARGWSPSGEHFALMESDDALQVYRTDDLAVVYRRAPKRNEGFLLIDDRAAYFVDRRGRFTRDAWR